MRIDRVCLIAEMARQEVSIEELAARSGVSRSSIVSMRGGKSVRKETVEKIAQALNTDPESLKGGLNDGSVEK